MENATCNACSIMFFMLHSGSMYDVPQNHVTTKFEKVICRRGDPKKCDMFGVNVFDKYKLPKQNKIQFPSQIKCLSEERLSLICNLRYFRVLFDPALLVHPLSLGPLLNS